MDTEKYLKNWEDGKSHLGDVLINHFKKHGARDVIMICEEALHLYKIMFDEEVSEDSSVDHIHFALAVQARNGGLAAVADCLGIKKDALQYVIDEWYFLCSDSDRNDPDYPPPISTAEFFRRIKKQTDEEKSRKTKTITDDKKEKEAGELQLLPCPFCDADMTLDRIVKKGGLFNVVCGHCIASGPLSLNPKQAVSGWNARK